MRVLVACEFSGIVRDAFLARGHDAWSCDIQDTVVPGPHLTGDVFKFINDGWDLMIGHPPCTFLTVTGNKWMKPEFAARFPTRQQDRIDAIAFFVALMEAPIPRIALENPVGIMSTAYRKPDQIIQPYHFGDRATKTTCLWLKALPPLMSLGCEVAGKGERIFFKSGKSFPAWMHGEVDKLPPKERTNARSVTFKGIANAMADQWGSL